MFFFFWQVFLALTEERMAGSFPREQEADIAFSNGLSHEMELAFDEMHWSVLGQSRERGQF
jgi:hypothetical protein